MIGYSDGEIIPLGKTGYTRNFLKDDWYDYIKVYTYDGILKYYDAERVPQDKLNSLTKAPEAPTENLDILKDKLPTEDIRDLKIFKTLISVAF